jgi:hypothetical protein
MAFTGLLTCLYPEGLGAGFYGLLVSMAIGLIKVFFLCSFDRKRIKND